MKVTPWLPDLIPVVLVRRWMMQFTMSVKWSYLEKLIMGEIALRKGKIKEKLEDEYYCCCSLTQLCLTLRPHGLQHTRLPYPSPSPRFCSNSCPLSQWCHPTISSAVIPFSCLRSFPASGSFPVSQLFTSGGQSIGVSASASVLPMNI